MASLSLAVAIVLVAGHWFRADVLTHYLPAGAPPAYYRQIHFTFGRGGVRAISSTFRPVPPPIPPIPPGLSFQSPWIGVRPETATLHRALWDFRCNRLPVPMASVYQVGFPLWCPLLPSLIAPILWCRRRLRERTTDCGFDVIPAVGESRK